MPVTLGITGSQGFLGWHIRARLKATRPDIMVRLADRRTFEDPAALADFARGTTAIVHAAGINRASDEVVEDGNANLAGALAEACAAAARDGAAPRIVYANSTHISRDTPYGRGKKRAGEILEEAGERLGGGAKNLVFPNIFGEFGRPFYNSGVSTFCHQLMTGETPTLIQDGRLELIHAQDAAQRMIEAAITPDDGIEMVAGVESTVSGVLAKLTAMSRSYLEAGIVPEFETAHDVDLFNTLRSYLPHARWPLPLKINADTRGHLVEVIKSRGGGQTFFSTTNPGITRGNHFHLRKVERFLVCSGEAEIKLRRIFTDDVLTFKVCGDQPTAIDMPTFHTHSITNTGSGTLTTLFWSNEIFDPDNPDTFAEPVHA